MSDSRISKKILSEIRGHDIWNLNVGSIGNLWKFAILVNCHSECSISEMKNLVCLTVYI